MRISNQSLYRSIHMPLYQMPPIEDVYYCAIQWKLHTDMFFQTPSQTTSTSNIKVMVSLVSLSSAISVWIKR
ncbi:hypothetical protein Pfo_022849 [Paulownia fortunei]|nr:hypothetical protein Pfo_022849 [Paulownia fortunei]